MKFLSRFTLNRRRWLQTMTCLFGVPTASALADDAVGLPFVTALADTIVPEDQDPGAVASGAVEFVYNELLADQDMHTNFRELSLVLNGLCMEKHGTPFDQADLVARTETLTRWLDESNSRGPARRAWVIARFLVIRHFYRHPVGWEVVGWHPPYRGYNDHDRLPNTDS